MKGLRLLLSAALPLAGRASSQPVMDLMDQRFTKGFVPIKDTQTYYVTPVISERSEIRGVSQTMASSAYKSAKDISIGEVSESKSGMGMVDSLFVPGSISDARESGHEFTTAMAKRGIDMVWINSQMDIGDYPSQKLGTDAANLRNTLVVDGIKKFVEENISDRVTIVAHSAGAKETLRAVRELSQNGNCPGKKINIVLLGAGGVSEDLVHDFESLKKFPDVAITEFRQEMDPVPILSGTGIDDAGKKLPGANYERITIPSEAASQYRERIEETQEIEEVFTLTNFARLAAHSVQSHFVSSYQEPVASYLVKKKEERELLASRKSSSSEILATVTEEDRIVLEKMRSKLVVSREQPAKKTNSGTVVGRAKPYLSI